MNIEEITEYCLSKAGAFESFPFGEENLVVKVGLDNGRDCKMFALLPLDTPDYIALKCEPEKAIRLRDEFPEITPAYHFNKRHWNGVRTDGSIPVALLREMIDDSYDLVCASLPVKVRDALKK